MIIYSVPHTGTHFLKKLTGLHALHYNSDIGENEIIISPIRDPFDTWQSWQRRGSEQDFFTPWFNFSQAWEQLDVTVLPIDTPDRDKHLKALSIKLSTELYTDWMPENSKAGPDVELTVDLSSIYALPVVREYYAIG